MKYVYSKYHHLCEVLHDLCVAEICDLDIKLSQHPVTAIFRSVNR